MALTRRQFLQRSGLATAGSLLLPGWLGNPFARRAFAQALQDRYLVVCFLQGGNDGLNTVVPVADGASGALRQAYEVARGTGSGGLRLSPAELAATAIGADPGSNTPLALHPAMTGIKSLYDQGKVAVLQNCGYPNPNLSHEESRVKWERGDPLNTGLGTGWMGRYLAGNYGPLDLPAVSIGGGVPGELAQTGTGVLTFYALEWFGFPADYWYWDDIGDYEAAFAALQTLGGGSPQAMQSLIGNTGNAAYTATQVYPPLHDDYLAERASWNSQYDVNPTYFKEQLREVAKVIYGTSKGAVDSRIFSVTEWGFDTHGDQGGATGAHAGLLGGVSDGLELFYSDLADMGLADDVCILVWSEFGRRVPQNSNGTDHGSQAPMFAIGGSVNGGIYGNHPDIAEASLDWNGNTVYSQDAGNPFRSTDFRDVYGTVLKHWLGVGDPSILLPVDAGDPTVRWTNPNFDLGFL
jgi:uncharacterized protein (DUF1501 family)